MAKGIVIKDRDGDKDQHQPKGREKTEQETGKEREKTTSKALREHFSAHFEKLRAHREQADAAMLVEDDAGEGPKEEGHAAGRENPDTADSERQGIRQSPRTRQLLSASPPLLPPSADEGQPGQETTQLQEAGGDRSTSWDQAAALLLYQPPPGPEVKVEPVVDITVPGELYGSDSNGALSTPEEPPNRDFRQQPRGAGGPDRDRPEPQETALEEMQVTTQPATPGSFPEHPRDQADCSFPHENSGPVAPATPPPLRRAPAPATPPAGLRRGPGIGQTMPASQHNPQHRHQSPQATKRTEEEGETDKASTPQPPAKKAPAPVPEYQPSPPTPPAPLPALAGPPPPHHHHHHHRHPPPLSQTSQRQATQSAGIQKDEIMEVLKSIQSQIVTSAKITTDTVNQELKQTTAAVNQELRQFRADFMTEVKSEIKKEVANTIADSGLHQRLDAVEARAGQAAAEAARASAAAAAAAATAQEAARNARAPQPPTTSVVQPSGQRTLVAVRGYATDTYKQEIQGSLASIIAEISHKPEDVYAPFQRGSKGYVRFADIKTMWAWLADFKKATYRHAGCELRAGVERTTGERRAYRALMDAERALLAVVPAHGRQHVAACPRAKRVHYERLTLATIVADDIVWDDGAVKHAGLDVDSVRQQYRMFAAAPAPAFQAREAQRAMREPLWASRGSRSRGAKGGPDVRRPTGRRRRRGTNGNGDAAGRAVTRPSGNRAARRRTQR
mmetsp:Transcript_38840/g.110805  ORF Transcript_38840/g.110805 Transcript_38840/m.110805 type:complete len:732 (-) Transcript_38840:14-2209(-)